MKAVLISIQPKWCELIASGQKTVDVRKTRPKIETPFKVYIYCTQATPYNPVLPMRYEKGDGNIYTCGKTYGEFLTGRVIGKFVCDAIFPMSIWYSNPNDRLSRREYPYTCLTDKEIMDYLGNGVDGYGWHISDLVIYDDPKKLSEFSTPCKMRERLCGICDYAVHGMDGDLIDCNTSLQRPPQSWCYVEELKGE